MENAPAAEQRGLMDIAICSVMRDGLLRISEAAALRWDDLDIMEDGTARIHIARSKTDAEGVGKELYLGVRAVQDLLAVRPAAEIDADDSIFRLGICQINRRIKAAAIAAGLGDGYSGHSGRVGMAQDLVAKGTDMPALMTAGRWKSPSMPARYTEKQNAGRGAVAGYYGGADGN